MLLNPSGSIGQYCFALPLIFLALFSATASGASIQATATNRLADGVAYSPDISPDGKTIAFTRGDSTIRLLDTAAGTTQVIQVAGANPRFSPKGDRICFETGQRIGIMQRDGTGVNMLTTNRYSARPYWAPDGKTIYCIAVQNNKLGVCALNADTGAMRIISQRNEMDAVPSPDGKYLAFVIIESNGTRTLGMMGADGDNPRLLLHGNVASGGYFSPRWSPDGKWLVMVYSQMQPSDNIVAMTIDGRQRVALTTDNARNATPVWSPDGKTIVFTKLAQQNNKAIQTLYSLTVAVDSKGIEDRLESLGTAFNPLDMKTADKLEIPPLAGPDLKAPLDVKPVPGAVESVCLNGRWEAIFGCSAVTNGVFTNMPPGKGWTPYNIPFRLTPFDRPVYNFSGSLPGWFRVSFVVPAEYQSRSYTELYFTSVDGHALYYLNDTKLGESSMPEIPVRLRADQLLRWGQANTLQVFVQPGKWAGPRAGSGIPGDVFLKSYPALYIDNIIVRTSVRKQTIESRIYVRNLTKQKADLTVTGAIQEEDGRTALDFEPQKVTAAPGTLTEVLFTKAWTNAVLWGFGNYGTQHLYYARHGIEQKGASAGVQVVRFGFREFWAEGTKFMFNSKPFFIKGDLNSLRNSYQNRGFARRYYQFLREGNMNFLRHHTSHFGNEVWFDVADEVGMLVEPQLYVTGPGEDPWKSVDMQWRNFIWKNANHPSIVIYSADNEALSGCTTPLPDFFARMNMRGKLLAALDPTRLVEWHGDNGLAVAVALGMYDNMQVWNTHPYGTPLGEDLKAQMRIYQYDGKSPIHVGEMVASHGDLPFVNGTQPLTVIRSKRLQNAFALAGDKLTGDIRSVAEAGASGASLCSAEGYAMFGPNDKGGFSAGPWHDESVRVDGKYNYPSCEIAWPSYSGRGMRPFSMSVGGNISGITIMNWFDPSRPGYTYNAEMLKIRAAFRDVDGQEPGPLTAPLKPEVVVMFAPDGTPAEGVFVSVKPLDGQPCDELSIMSDPNGSAWFFLWAAGRYQASATWNGKTYTNTFTAALAPAQPREVAGYGHVQFVDLAGKRAEKMRTEWVPRPVAINISNPHEVVAADTNKPVAKPPRLISTNFVAGPFQPDDKGFIRNWLVCGPFPDVYDPAATYWKGFRTDWLTNAGGERAIAPVFGQRHKVSYPDGQLWTAGDTEAFWDQYASPTPRVNLNMLTAPEMDIPPPRPVNVVGYAFCYLQVPADVDAQLALGFDDGGRAILNNEQVCDFPTHGAAFEDEHIVPVRLKKGFNLLLLKVDQSNGGYCFFCRFLKDNQPFTQYQVYLQAGKP
ncbi:MAG: glycoside hydrolase family 2 TIM barrel-domain containing protein [Kiritimatiellae bacterium]|nr:glycoside hydrolase family 2 TIM barrel-domain containing protein [Kiritimatiellia bacterium]